MKKLFLTVGPSKLYPTVPTHIETALQENIPSLSHRSQEFLDLFGSTTDNIRKLLDIPATHQIFFTSCSLEAMERIIQNTVEKKSYHCVNGYFSNVFYSISHDLRKDAQKLEVPAGDGFNFDKIDLSNGTETFCVTHTETSSGVTTSMQDIYRLKEKYPSVLVALDIVSAVPYVSVDFSQIDMAFFSVQKGMGLPAGLCVLIVNEKALEKSNWLHKKGISTGSYHSFASLREFAEKNQTVETPNVLDIYLLEKVTRDMLSKGIDRIREETDTKAELLYNFFEKHSQYKPVVEESIRAKTVVVLDSKGNTFEIAKKLSDKGFAVSTGYAENQNKYIRVANFPALSIEDTKNFIHTFKELFS